MKFQTYRNFSKEVPKFNWLVEDLIPQGGWTLLVGPPGSGKSMMAIQLTDCVQNGRPFLGQKVKQGNCLYIQADASSGEWQEQIKNIAPDGFSWTGYEVPKGALDMEKEVAIFKRIIWGEQEGFGGEQFDFVVFDCLRSLTEKDINSTAIMQVIRKMQEICTLQTDDLKLEKTFLLIHHPTKTRGVRGTSAGAGYGGLESDCSSMMTLAGTMLAREKGRVQKNRHFDLVRLPNGAWSLASEGAPKSNGQVFNTNLTQNEKELFEKYPEFNPEYRKRD